MCADEGLQVAQRMLEDSGDKVATIKKLVLQMNDTDDARNLITSLLENDRTEMLRLKRDFGAALRPILGNPNGYYILDLAKEMDRMWSVCWRSAPPLAISGWRRASSATAG